jgi:methylmalonyl-CoA/ethylmalonyl-CoA epimerase
LEKDWTFTHFGLVVRDIEKTLQYYESLGIFYIPNKVPFLMAGSKVKIRGVHIFLGTQWIEIFQPAGGDSIQQRFLDAHGEGVNHIGYQVADLEKERAYLASRGVPVAFHVKNSASYYNTGENGNMLIELSLGRETPESAATGKPSAEALN